MMLSLWLACIVGLILVNLGKPCTGCSSVGATTQRNNLKKGLHPKGKFNIHMRPLALVLP
eukprot:2259300-Prorocentrum_lima.AAC.1